MAELIPIRSFESSYSQSSYARHRTSAQAPQGEKEPVRLRRRTFTRFSTRRLSITPVIIRADHRPDWYLAYGDRQIDYVIVNWEQICQLRSGTTCAALIAAFVTKNKNRRGQSPFSDQPRRFTR
jgi:hypothetical protein